MPKVDDSIDWQKDEPKWQKLMDLRDKVLGVLEPLRKDKIIGSNQESSCNYPLRRRLCGGYRTVRH